jgi:hypothetical protein
MSFISWIFLALCIMVRLLFFAKATWWTTTTTMSSSMMIAVSSQMPSSDTQFKKSTSIGGDDASAIDDDETRTANAAITKKRTSSSFTSSSSSPYRDQMVGTWIGKTWIPPHPWRYYDATELRAMYADKRVLWIGDSTGRRAFATLYGILNATLTSTTSTTTTTTTASSSSDNNNSENTDDDEDQLLHVSTSAIDKPSVIDVNRGKQVEFCAKWNHIVENNSNSNNTHHLYDLHPQICRPAPGGGNGEFSFIQAACYNQLERILTSELAGTTNMTADVNVIVVSLGIWEVMKAQTCNRLDVVYAAATTTNGSQPRKRPRNPNQRLADAVNVAARFATTTGVKIVWRTSGYAKPETVLSVNALNHRTMKAIDDALVNVGNVVNNNNNHHQSSNKSNISSKNANLMYVNWGKAMQPRSFGPDALDGDIHAHYAMEARLVLVQMITNRLVDNGFFASSSLYNQY